MKASELKSAAIANIDGTIFLAKEVTVKTLSSRA